ncbi:MAG: nuclear transport factor 2 family protein [Pseudomonadota bacterium]
MGSREQIIKLINHYGFTIDTGDLHGFSGLFEHAQWIMEGTQPIETEAQWAQARDLVILYEDGTPRTKHLTSNIDLEIDEEAGRAQSQSYVTVLQQTDELPLQVIFSGHYFDEFERVEGHWRFTKRHIRHPLVGNMSAHLKSVEAIIPAS